MDEHEYIECMRVALGVRLFIITGWVWEVRQIGTRLDIQFRMKYGEFIHTGASIGFSEAFTQKGVEELPDRIYLMAYDSLYSWMHNLRMF